MPLRTLWTAKYEPHFVPFAAGSWQAWGLASIPLMTFLADTTMEDTRLSNLLIVMEDPDDHETIDEIAKAFEEEADGDQKVQVSYTAGETTSKIRKVLDKVFYGLISVTMFLCFFSLCASMSANLYEQKKEVGLLRALGFTKYRVRMLYFYESLVLVLSSCMMGVLIGTVVGYTMLLQFNLLLHASVAPFFPWQQFVLVAILSIICAFFSTWGPAVSLTNRSVAGIFRMV